MLGKWFRKVNPALTATANGATPAGERSPQRLDEIDASLMTEFLCAAKSILAMTPAEAALAASFMTPRTYGAGDIVFKEGDNSTSNFMLWILQGEATVETGAANPRDSLTMTVMEAGSTMGEMGLMDGGRRSATCTACNTLRCAVLTRSALRQLATQHPEIAAKLMSLICIGISTRLRDVNEKFKRYVVMSNFMREQHREALPNIQVREA